MTVAQELPRWDMTVIYPSLESSEFKDALREVFTDIDNLLTFYDAHHIQRTEGLQVDDVTVHTFETIMERYGALIEQLGTVDAFVHAFVTTDSRDARAQAILSDIEQHSVQLSQLDTRFTAWIGSLDVQELAERSQVARDHRYMLARTSQDARHLMPQAQEDLAAAMNVTGGSAWSKLHSTMTSQLMVAVEMDGEVHHLPMSAVRNLAMNPNRETRRAAYVAELQTWERVAVPMAAALNSIKGETILLDRRRDWRSPLDVALFNNGIDRETLDAMLGAARESFPDFRRYLRAKGRALGVGRSAWYDIFAPVGTSSRAWQFSDATAFMLDQFDAYSPRLRDFARRALDERWIDAEPREGKVGGAFCMKVRPGESRVLANFVPSYDGMSTLAHELGHAYHNFNLASRTPFQRSSPMTLAETASIFCETIVREAALADADRQEQVLILEASIQGDAQVVVDITSRFLFESRLFEARSEREQSIEELNELMLQAQRETYGDGLDEGALHPYMWAVKGHYYSVGRPYYNFPYMFGLLFGLGLYARYRNDPDGFRSGYDELLSATGLADAATLASRFGIDIRTREFWASSLDVIRRDINRFEGLVDGGASSGN